MPSARPKLTGEALRSEVLQIAGETFERFAGTPWSAALLRDPGLDELEEQARDLFTRLRALLVEAHQFSRRSHLKAPPTDIGECWAFLADWIPTALVPLLPESGIERARQLPPKGYRWRSTNSRAQLVYRWTRQAPNGRLLVPAALAIDPDERAPKLPTLRDLACISLLAGNWPGEKKVAATAPAIITKEERLVQQAVAAHGKFYDDAKPSPAVVAQVRRRLRRQGVAV